MESWFPIKVQKSQWNIFYQEETKYNLPVDTKDSTVLHFSCNPDSSAP